MATFGTFTSGQTLTAAELNTAGEWQSYTPTWTQSTAITKTVDWARYTQLNKLVIVNIKMTATNSGTASNNITVSLPVNASSNNFLMGIAAFDASTDCYNFVFYDTSSTVSFSTGEFANTANLGARRQTQVVSGQIVYLNLTYEAA